MAQFIYVCKRCGTEHTTTEPVDSVYCECAWRHIEVTLIKTIEAEPAAITLSNYSRCAIGANAVSLPTVCTDGKIRQVRTEQYTEGYAAFVTKEDGHTYTNHHCYPTARKARNAAAKW